MKNTNNPENTGPENNESKLKFLNKPEITEKIDKNLEKMFEELFLETKEKMHKNDVLIMKELNISKDQLERQKVEIERKMQYSGEEPYAEVLFRAIKSRIKDFVMTHDPDLFFANEAKWMLMHEDSFFSHLQEILSDYDSNNLTYRGTNVPAVKLNELEQDSRQESLKDTFHNHIRSRNKNERAFYDFLEKGDLESATKMLNAMEVLADSIEEQALYLNNKFVLAQVSLDIDLFLQTLHEFKELSKNGTSEGYEYIFDASNFQTALKSIIYQKIIKSIQIGSNIALLPSQLEDVQKTYSSTLINEIVDFMEQNGFPKTETELRDLVDISDDAAKEIVQKYFTFPVLVQTEYFSE